MNASVSDREPHALFSDSDLFEEVPFACYVCDSTGKVIRRNRMAEECGDWSAVADLRDAAGESIPDLGGLVAAVVAQDGPLRGLAVKMAGHDGRSYRFAANANPVRAASGKVVGAIICLGEPALAAPSGIEPGHSAGFLRALMETTPECVTVVARDGALVQINTAGRRMIEGRDAQAVEEISFIDLVASEDRASWKRNHRRVCAGESRNWSFDIIGLRGTRRHMETHAAPLHLPNGEMAQLAITRDVTVRKNQSGALLDRERWFRGLLEALPVAVYTTDADGRITFYNGAAAELWGRRPPLYKSEWCGSWRLFTAEGAPLPHDQCPMAIALKERRAVRNFEAIAERPDGKRIPFTPYPTPLFDGDGNLVGAVNMLVDISRHKHAAERQQGLINELNHRVKNTLATVQSIAAQTFRGHAEVLRIDRFEERLMALAKAHDILAAEQWRRASLDQVLRQVLLPLREGVGDRVHLVGPAVNLTPKMALAFALAFHELGRNALSHGALAVPQGSVRVSWQLVRGAETEGLRLRWAESGGPPVSASRPKGFGSRMIKQGLAHDLGADIVLDHGVGGPVCDIDVPLVGSGGGVYDDLSA